MLATDAASAAATWRPQLFGDLRSRQILDPIVEPLWTGPRVLAFVDDSTVSLTDVDGAPIQDEPAIEAALRDAADGATLLIEAFLTPEPLQAAADIAGREVVVTPKVGDAVSQMFLGSRGDRKLRLADHKDEARQRTVEGAEDQRLALVAVDLLWLDDDSLCDVPLLERKRILEAVLLESHLVRVGIYVKPPIDAWLGSWRAFGFHRISFKAANSRYIPGQKNQDWSQAEIPRR